MSIFEEEKNFWEDISGKNVNFLIGSGASFPYISTLHLGDKMPTFEELVTSNKIKEVNKKILYAYYFDKWISEMFLSTIVASKEEVYQKVLRNYKRLVSNLLVFLQREGNEKPKRVNLFTTNYDLFFERTFDEINKDGPFCYFNDGSKGFIEREIGISNFHMNVSHSGVNDRYKREVPTINLLKIHGSVTWNRKQGEKDKIIVSYQDEQIKRLKDQLSSIEEYSRAEIENINERLLDRLHDEETKISIEHICEELSQLNLPDDKFSDFYELYKQIPIINPNKWKFNETVFEQHYYQLLRLLSYELEKIGSVLIVFGFSFADEHITEIIKRSMSNPSLKVYIISYNQGSKETIEQKLGSYSNITFLPQQFVKTDGSNLNGDFDFLNNLFEGIDSYE
ncbi:SIR2 family protein [Planomicrobium sp. YIM 101495]|uniref:SIR2 family protein n=1 Tax=Planomicrobium sp. YIM 101495 TaxID=2665160 RepID=UPI0012B732BC|nr:SIR2 family protein [Planomicrobium sp. YIM 101495]MTD31883.1 hypothetical protein [Planomicrobium sp. YIM 101495]